jgi:hypothetical protein
MSVNSFTVSRSPVWLFCKRCKRDWVYRGKNPYVATCSFCKTTVSVKNSKMKEFERNERVNSPTNSSVFEEARRVCSDRDTTIGGSPNG